MRAGMSWIIETDNLVKTYGKGEGAIRALDGITLRVAAGEMLAVMGESGSGKSTLMNIIGCLDRPDSGRYLLAGDDVSTLSEDQQAVIRNRRIGFIFQSFNLLPRLSALENVELPLLYAGRPGAKQAAEEALTRVGLAARIDHLPTALSGGQRQRVSIARALVTSPDLILADEPTGNLDSVTGEEIMELFRQLNGEGRTFVIVTHNTEVAGYCHNRIRLRDGRVLDTAARAG